MSRPALLSGVAACLVGASAACANISGLDDLDFDGGARGGGGASASSSSSMGATSTTGPSGGGGGEGGGSAGGGGSTATTSVSSSASASSSSSSTSTGAGGSLPVCGDGQTEGVEACDDGNVDPWDGCSAGCTVEDPRSCDGVPPASLGLGEVIVAQGDTTTATASTIDNGACNGNIANNFVYRLVPAADGVLTVSITANYDSVLYFHTACPIVTTSIVCDNTGFAVNVTGGTLYHVFVGGHSTMPTPQGPFTLFVSLN